jgi:hypothetical protein
VDVRESVLVAELIQYEIISGVPRSRPESLPQRLKPRFILPDLWHD